MVLGTFTYHLWTDNIIKILVSFLKRHFKALSFSPYSPSLCLTLLASHSLSMNLNLLSLFSLPPFTLSLLPLLSLHSFLYISLTPFLFLAHLSPFFLLSTLTLPPTLYLNISISSLFLYSLSPVPPLFICISLSI